MMGRTDEAEAVHGRADYRHLEGILKEADAGVAVAYQATSGTQRVAALETQPPPSR